MKNYPIMLQLNGRRAVVFGGGKVANRKVNALLKMGAAVEVVSPQIVNELLPLIDEGTII